MNKENRSRKKAAAMPGNRLSDSILYKMRLLVRRAFNRCASEYDRHMGSRPLNQWNVLIHLADSHPVPMAAVEISERTDIDKYSLSRIITALEKEGLIERLGSTKDERKNDLHLTTAGELLAKSLTSHGASYTNEVYSVLTREEMMVLEMLVARLNERTLELINQE